MRRLILGFVACTMNGEAKNGDSSSTAFDLIDSLIESCLHVAREFDPQFDVRDTEQLGGLHGIADKIHSPFGVPICLAEVLDVPSS